MLFFHGRFSLRGNPKNLAATKSRIASYLGQGRRRGVDSYGVRNPVKGTRDALNDLWGYLKNEK